jgi:DNA-binding response OmpR family regulator
MKKKILIIEDDEIFGNIYRNRLILDGFEVDVASDGESGYEKLNTFRPDVILLDLILPKLQGVDLIKKIRSESQFKQLPLVVFTNTYLTSIVQEAWKAGATKCLAKASSTPNEVISTLRSVLEDGHKKLSVTSAPVQSEPSEDQEFQIELRKSFIEGLPASLATLRSQLQSLIKTTGESARVQLVHEMYRKVHAITGSASIVGMSEMARLTDALEALLKELHGKPNNISTSTLRTVAAAIDFLGILFEQRSTQKALAPARVLVVEDEVISRRAINYALEKAKLRAIDVEDPLHAFDLLEQNKFDLIFLDVDMPNMSGYELCSKLRNLHAHKNTPVVFITSLNDFESRANSTMSGGNDFIVKPFLFVELAVKALVYVLRGRLQTPQGRTTNLTRTAKAA